MQSQSAKAKGHALYPNLLSPIDIGTVRIRNRMMMGSMHTRVETTDRFHEREIAYYLARANANIGLIVSGGLAPNDEGLMELDSLKLTRDADLGYQRELCSAIAGTGVPFFAQILHAGRYAKFDGCVGASEIPSPINRRKPRRLETAEVWRTIDEYARAAEIAREVGFVGIEVMGSEGYFINQFLSPRTNDRDDEFGGSLQNRMRLALGVIRAIRKSMGRDYPIMYRISALELVEGGMTQAEILELARNLQAEGVDCLNSGIGWHESRVPTVAYVAPRAAWAEATAAIRNVVKIPVIASNRINDPAVAENLIASGKCDLVSLSRQMLADAEFAAKAEAGTPEAINTCIACNQACLDMIFRLKPSTCLVNPRALREIEFPTGKAATPKRIAMVGAGAAGMTCAFEAAARGHDVTLYEKSGQLGGLLQLARNVPDKIEFDELIRYLAYRVKAEGVTVKLNASPSAADLKGFDEVVIATGVRPRQPDIAGIDHPKVAGYEEILTGARQAGNKVAILGAGGIGFDTAEYLLDQGRRAPDAQAFLAEHGIEIGSDLRGSFDRAKRVDHPPMRKITMLQRTPGKLGRTLSITTDWIKRERLERANVETIAGATYQRIDDAGLHILLDGKVRLIEADTIVLCTGQESERGLATELDRAGIRYTAIGGAHVAAELDAMRAIDQATRLAVGF
ncbi:MAG: FAD-dependent oxidoreductase [Rhodospirillales bacterium]